MARILDKNGAPVEVKVGVEEYKAAADAGLTLPQHLNRKYPTVASAGTPWEQLCASSGLIRTADRDYGLRTPTVADVLSGKAAIGAATTLEADPTSRVLYPAAVLEMIFSALQANTDEDPRAFGTMVAIDTSVTNARAEQPVINVSGPEAGRSKAVGQLAEPNVMLSITTADQARSLPTLGIGLEISDQALQATTLDLVSMAVSRQSAVERNTRVNEYLLAFLQGDVDHGQSALAQTKADTYDAGITAAGTLSKTAIVKWLFNNYSTRGITHIVTDVAGLLAFEAALASTHTGNYPMAGLVPNTSIINRMMENLQFFVTDANAGTAWPANTLMGIDSRWAIHRITNVGATYSAIEEFVLRRSKVLRFDFSEIALRLFDDAYDTLSLTLT